MTMKAVQMHTFGNVDVLHYEEIEQPLPQAGEVLVQVHAAGINPIDWLARSYPMPTTTGAAGVDLPYILGWDIAGSVVALGPGVTQFAIGACHSFPERPKRTVSIRLSPPQTWHTNQLSSPINKQQPSRWQH